MVHFLSLTVIVVISSVPCCHKLYFLFYQALFHVVTPIFVFSNCYIAHLWPICLSYLNVVFSECFVKSMLLLNVLFSLFTAGEWLKCLKRKQLTLFCRAKTWNNHFANRKSNARRFTTYRRMFTRQVNWF